MEFFRHFLRRPRQLGLWKFNFQVHLWLGIIIALYLVVIGVTGSILVFRDELEALAGLNPWQSLQTTEPFADITEVIRNVQAAYPGRPVISVYTPTETDPVFEATVQGQLERITVAAHPKTGAVLGVVPSMHSWLSVVRDLHVNLMVGPKGRAANGIGGALLVLLNITGLVIWWPGIKSWKRALKIDFRRTWRRVNYDLHNAVGFWTLALVTFWGISGFYFGWSREVFLFVDRISPIISARPPVVTVKPVSDPVALDLKSILVRAYVLDAGTSLEGIQFPYNRRAPLEIYMRRGNHSGAEYMDTLYFNPWDGSHIRTWRYGVNESLGDWFIWLQIPLHYGTYWGRGIKALWALLSLMIPLIAITGIIMYWNRVLRRKWKRLKDLGRQPSSIEATLAQRRSEPTSAS
jgi:uncharacterized iron-regulated membrane protein